VLSNVEVLQFSDAIVLLSSGTAGSPTDISTLQLLGGAAPVIGTASDDYVRVGSNIFGHQLNLGDGTADTVILNPNSFGNGFTLNLSGVEYLTGTSSGEFVSLTSNASGLVVDLGDGADNLALAGGVNSLSITDVESIGGTDFGPTPAVNDVLTLQNNVSGVSISLGNGDNTLNLAGGANSFTNIFDVNHVNGTASADTLTITDWIGAANGITIDLGDGNDVLNLNTSVFGMAGSVSNTETINGSANLDNITIVNSVTGSTTITAGAGMDVLTASAGHDTFRFTSTADSGGAGIDTINNFDAANDTFAFSGISVAGGRIEFVDNGGDLLGGNQASARLQSNGPGNDLLQIDTDGNGTTDMEVSLQNLAGTLHTSNFLLP
jgi:Ca2+-binding RTX toxin-like protein